MALLPARNILDGTALPVTSQMKTALGSLRDYCSDLLGTDSGNKAAARTALGAAASGANSDITSLTGVATNSDAAAGKIGEFVTASRSSGSPLALTTNTHTTLTSITLTAGDWDVSGAVGYVTASPSTNVLRFRQSASITSGVDGPNPSIYPFSGTPNTGGAGGIVFPLAVSRFSLSVTTTVYLIGYGLFDTAGLSAYGTIQARRVR